MRNNTIILNTIAKTMNAGGSAIVSAYDAGAGAFNCTMSALSPSEKTKLRTRIKTLEKKIQTLYLEIGKETSKYLDPAEALESESVIATLGNIKELDNEIDSMKQRIAEIDAIKVEKKPQQDSSSVTNFFIHSLSGFLPGEKATLQRKIFENEKKIQTLYSEFAKEAAKQPDPSVAICSEAVTGIISRINELKVANDSLKTRITQIAEKSQEKPKPVEKKQQQESPGIAKFFLHALTDSISGLLPGEKGGSECKTTECEKTINDGISTVDAGMPSSAANNVEQDDVSVIGYDRTKPCLIPPPNLLPPVREEISIADHGIQTGEPRDEKPALIEVSEVAEVIPEPVTDEADSAVIAAADETAADAEIVDKGEHDASISVSDVAEVMPEPVADAADSALTAAADVSPADAEIEDKGEQAASVAVSDVSEVIPEPEAGTADSALTAAADVSPADAEIEDKEEHDETSEKSEDPYSEDVPIEEHEKKKPALTNEIINEREIWKNTAGSPDEFSGVRSRIHTTSFTSVPELRPDISVPDPISAENSANESGPSFRARVLQNTFTSITTSSGVISSEERVGPIDVKVAGKKIDAPPQHAVPETASEQKPVFRTRVHQNAFSPIAAASEKIYSEEETDPTEEAFTGTQSNASTQHAVREEVVPQAESTIKDMGEERTSTTKEPVTAISKKNKLKRRG